MFLIQLLTIFDFKNGGFFGHIYEKHNKTVYGFIYVKVGNHHDTEEIAVDTFFEIWKSIDRFKGINEQDEKSLIIKYARNNVIDYYRKKKVRISASSLSIENDDDEMPYDIPDNSQNPEVIFDNKQNYNELISHIEQLSDEQREVLELKYQMGMSNKDISEILKINIEAVNSRIYRAKRTLEKELNGENA